MPTNTYDPYAPQPPQQPPRRVDTSHYAQPAQRQPDAPADYYQPAPPPGPVVPAFAARPAVPPPDMSLQPVPPGAVVAAQPVAPPSAPSGRVDAPDYSVRTLSRPYKAHDLDVKVVRLRKPLTAEIRKYGSPIHQFVDERGLQQFDIKWDTIANYVAVLSDPPLPPSTINAFDFEDLDEVGGGIIRFFIKARMME